MKIWKIICTLALGGVAVIGLSFCGGGGSSTSPVPTTNYNASAAAGDYIKLTVDLSDGTYGYENVTTGRNEIGTVAENPTTKELSFTVTTSTGGGSGDGSASELVTGFVVPDIGIALIANNTGASSDITSMVFGVPHRNHTPGELINLVPTGSTANYIRMQFRTLDAGFEIGYIDIEGNQTFTDVTDLNNNASVVDTINGAPLFGEMYSSVSGVPDPNLGLPISAFSGDVINPTDIPANQVPFLEASADASYLIHRGWEDIGAGPVIVDNRVFCNSAKNKTITDNAFGISITLESPGNSLWSTNYEGTYNVVEYNGYGVPGGTDTFDSAGTLVFEIGNDGSGNGLLTVVGHPTYQNITLSSFTDLEAAGLLGEVVDSWPDGTPINGVFGFTLPPNPLDDPNDLGQEFFFIFSDGVVFFVQAQLTGPRDNSGGDLQDWPALYTYSYGGGLKM